MKTSAEIFNSNFENVKPAISEMILSKPFAPSESTVISIRHSDFKINLGVLLIRNDKGQSAQFSWQQNLIPTHLEKGYFKEIINDLGVTVHYNEDSITVINGGAPQFLTAELKI